MDEGKPRIVELQLVGCQFLRGQTIQERAAYANVAVRRDIVMLRSQHLVEKSPYGCLRQPPVVAALQPAVLVVHAADCRDGTEQNTPGLEEANGVGNRSAHLEDDVQGLSQDEAVEL